MTRQLLLWIDSKVTGWQHPGGEKWQLESGELNRSDSGCILKLKSRASPWCIDFVVQEKEKTWGWVLSWDLNCGMMLWLPLETEPWSTDTHQYRQVLQRQAGARSESCDVASSGGHTSIKLQGYCRICCIFKIKVSKTAEDKRETLCVLATLTLCVSTLKLNTWKRCSQ